MKRFPGWVFALGMILCTLLCTQAYTAHAEQLELPDNLKVIADKAFIGNTSIETVVLPEGIERIGSLAFASSGVKNINFPDSLSPQNVAIDAFEGCGHLEAYPAGDNGRAVIEKLSAYANIHDATIPLQVDENRIAVPSDRMIVRTFTAEQTGAYRFSGSAAVQVSICFMDAENDLIEQPQSGIILYTGEKLYVGMQASGSTDAELTLTIERHEVPSEMLVYTASLKQYRDGSVISDAGAEADLSALGLLSYYTPALAVTNTGSAIYSTRITAALDGKEIDLGYMTLPSGESTVLHLTMEQALTLEIAGEHSVVWYADGVERAAFSWQTTGSRTAEPQTKITTGTNYVIVDNADGNYFTFTATTAGNYRFETTGSLNTFGSVHDPLTGAELASNVTSADRSGQNFGINYNLKANQTIVLRVGMNNYNGKRTLTLTVTKSAKPSLSYSVSLHKSMAGGWYDEGDMKGKANLSDLNLIDHYYYTPVLILKNKSSSSTEVTLRAVVDGTDVKQWTTFTVDGGSSTTWYLYLPLEMMYAHETEGTHEVVYYLNGDLLTRYTWTFFGQRGRPTQIRTMTMGENAVSAILRDGNTYTFTAPYTGVYNIYTTDYASTPYSAPEAFDRRGVLYDEDMNILATDDNSQDGHNFRISYFLTAGQKVYIGVYLQNTNIASKMTNLYIEPGFPVP